MPKLVQEMNREDLKGFLGSVREDDERKVEQRKRAKIYLEDFDDIINERIDAVYTDPVVKKQLKKFSGVNFLNPLKSIVDRLNMAYRSRPNRFIENEDGEQVEETNRKFLQLLDEGHIDIHARDWLKWTLVQNVTIVVPRIIHDGEPRIKWSLIQPHLMEVITRMDDPDVVEVCGYRHPSVEGWIITLDAEEWRVYDEEDRIRDVQPHGLGVFPGVVYRIQPMQGDFWSSSLGNSMIAATIEIGMIQTFMSWVRRSQNRKLQTLAAENLQQAIPAGQLQDAEKPVEVNASPNQFKYDVVDLDTSIQGFKEHIRFVMDSVTEQQGIPALAVDFPENEIAVANSAVMAASVVEKLNRKFKEHVEWLTIVERDLAWKTVLVAQANEHRLTKNLNATAIRDGFFVRFPPLTVPDDPTRKIEYLKKKIELNIGFSHVDAAMELEPGLTREQARRQIMRGIEERKIVSDFHAENNLGSDASMGTLAQQNGREGGLRSGDARREQSEESDDMSDESATE